MQGARVGLGRDGSRRHQECWHHIAWDELHTHHAQYGTCYSKLKMHRRRVKGSRLIRWMSSPCKCASALAANLRGIWVPGEDPSKPFVSQLKLAWYLRNDDLFTRLRIGCRAAPGAATIEEYLLHTMTVTVSVNWKVSLVKNSAAREQRVSRWSMYISVSLSVHSANFQAL